MQNITLEKFSCNKLLLHNWKIEKLYFPIQNTICNQHSILKLRKSDGSCYMNIIIS